MEEKRASSAEESWKGWPCALITLIAFTGIMIAQLPAQAFAFSAMMRPSSVHSSGVVRISVTCRLWI